MLKIVERFEEGKDKLRSLPIDLLFNLFADIQQQLKCWQRASCNSFQVSKQNNSADRFILNYFLLTCRKLFEKSRITSLAMIFSLVFLIAPQIAWSESKQSISKPEDCIAIKSSLHRLTCFDQYFNTPVVIEDKKQNTKTLRARKSKIMQMAMRIESQRNEEMTGLLREEIMEHEAAGQQRIILTTPAIGKHPPRPLLMISCINNITRLQIGLHDSINRGRVDVALDMKGRSQQTDYSWRVLGAGQIIDAGHGIPSINLLKTMIGHNRVLIHSEDMALEGMTFDITGFTHYVKSFRKACHW